MAGNIAGSAEGGRAGFVPFQLVMVSPLLVPVWIAGLLAPFRRPALRALRFVPLTYAVLAVAYLVGNGKAYYLASLYPVLLGLGALPAADWTRRARCAYALALRRRSSSQRRDQRGDRAAAAARAIAAGQHRDGGQPGPGRDGRLAAVRRHRRRGLARDPAGRASPDRDLHAATTARPARSTCSGASRGLPRAYSGHNGFSEWGQPPAGDTTRC